MIEAAVATDRVVISLDEVARGLFRQCCSPVVELREIHWANPSIDEERVVPWLERGARVEKKRKLGGR